MAPKFLIKDVIPRPPTARGGCRADYKSVLRLRRKIDLSTIGIVEAYSRIRTKLDVDPAQTCWVVNWLQPECVAVFLQTLHSRTLLGAAP